MDDPERSELLEIYRLHADLADRVSQRREGANRLYVSLSLALVLFLAALFRFGFGDVPGSLVVTVVGAVGIALSASWFLVIRSYRQLNTGKLKALHELEERLGYPFFKREWELLGEGKDRTRYFRLTQAEAVLPWIFSLLFFGVVAVAVFRGLPADTSGPSSSNPDNGPTESSADSANQETGSSFRRRQPELRPQSWPPKFVSLS